MAKLGNLIKDSSQTAVQIGGSFVTQDGATSPITSPLTMNGSVQTLTVPVGAVECILYPLANLLQVSELSALTRYDTVAGTSKESFPCARMTTIYVKGTLSDTLYFRFTIV